MRKGIPIVVHVLFCYGILIVGSDSAAMEGGRACRLSLAGSSIIPFIPFVGIAVYALIVFVTRKASKRWIRIGGIPGAYLVACICISYPDWIFERYSHKIEIGSFVKNDEMFLPNNEITNFERTFNTPTVQFSSSSGGPWLVVPRNKFTVEMILFLRESAQEKVKPINAPIGIQPLQYETNGAPSAAVPPDRK